MPHARESAKPAQFLDEYDSKSEVIVHVIDQVRGISKDFACSKDRVMAKMRYF